MPKKSPSLREPKMNPRYRKPYRRQYTITVYADNESALQEARDEACKSICRGNYAGTESNDEGGYHFDSSESYWLQKDKKS